MPKRSKKSKSKRVSLKKKYKIIKKVKDHHKKESKKAKKLGFNGKTKVEKDLGIPNDWPFKEQELKALEVRIARAIEELEQKKAARKERDGVQTEPSAPADQTVDIVDDVPMVDEEKKQKSGSSKQNEKLYEAVGILNTKVKKAEKKKKKKDDDSTSVDDTDGDYDFKVDYKKNDSAMEVDDGYPRVR